MGNINIDMLKYGSHDITDAYMYIDGILTRGFLPRILKPTRLTHTSLVDHIFTNEITVRSSSDIITNIKYKNTHALFQSKTYQISGYY